MHYSSRRTFLKAATGMAAAPLVGCSAQRQLTDEIFQHEPANGKSQVFVLVHGAWHGGWCWKYVRDGLVDLGHTVLTPTLTGLGERAHLLDASVGLDTHINDILNVVKYEELDDFVLVGHSYSGMVITAVADRIKSNIRKIVFLDAGVPEESGQSFISYGPNSTPESVAQTEAGLRAIAPDGVGMATFPAAVVGIPPEDVENTQWVERLMTPHPLKSWLDPISLRNGGTRNMDRAFIHCTTPPLANSGIPTKAAMIKNDPTWKYHEIATGHDAMITAPKEVVRILSAL